MPDTSVKRPLGVYVIAVCIVWAVILAGVWMWGGSRLYGVSVFCGGFLLGMLAMYIAVHVYRWK